MDNILLLTNSVESRCSEAVLDNKICILISGITTNTQGIYAIKV
jgi:hypothetical protein